jgi:plasmid stabilization system protein ParE
VIPVEFHPAARAELDASTAFYESRLDGLGLRFLAAVEETTGRIASSPEGGSPMESGLRRRLVPGFPFSVIYRVADDAVLVLAIAHQHRRPGYWHRRAPRR